MGVPMMNLDERCTGLEQEFFLVDGSGALSDRADGFLERCRELAKKAGRDPEGFAPECASCMVEINTPPVGSFPELAREYTAALKLALDASRDLGLRLYPLAAYPWTAFRPCATTRATSSRPAPSGGSGSRTPGAARGFTCTTSSTTATGARRAKPTWTCAPSSSRPSATSCPAA